jgi:uncharacterized protein (DUF2461 family)
MSGSKEFLGFFPETIQFFRDLSNNNNKTWFEENRHTFETYIMRPAQAFVVEMGKKLGEMDM